MSKHATTKQIIDAYSALTDNQIAMLRRAAKIHMRGTKFSEPFDLVHEVLDRLIEGVRHWPMRIDFCFFMDEAMRSIAYAERRRLENKLDAGADIDDLYATGKVIGVYTESVEIQIIAAEPGRIVNEAAREAKEAMPSDHLAHLVIDTLLAGSEPREACEDLGIDMNAYRAARKRCLAMIKRMIGDRLG